MIESLHYLPQAGSTHDALSERFTDLAPPLTARQAAIESARCLYCYDAPCTRACPTGIDVASFIRNIHDHNVDGAATTILQANIFGGSCARVCPTEILCEDACVRNHDAEGQPVKIGLLQRHAIDNAQFDGHPFKRAPSTGKTIAVVGAGPAGLSCAHRLAMLGHDVVVFEAREKSGGLNEYGIAKYKLPGDFAQREVEFLLSIGGIEIRHGYALGHNLQLAELHARYDAVFLGLGLAASRELGLLGENAPGLMAAVDYIATLRQSDDLSALPVPRRAIVIGAGNTAIDMAVQLKRLGAEEVTLVYRRGFEAMSATGHEIDIAKAHFVRMRTWAAPLEVLLDDAGRVRGMRFEETRMQDGRLVATGGIIEIAADAVFKAIGQGMGLAALVDPLAREIERTDKIVVDACLRTALPGVYAGGDCVAPGQDLTVQAVQHGKLAALAIHHDIQSKAEAAWPT
ncbi:NAD-dependent dihydropyrimidine dehydrogenase subunit PreT [Massilia sp. Bi118]|uniref:NAD(P)-dependent oxidoreductase n=1 Tax=Massilia sp. Bi118 TaxID=2822346 RepID=UPI001E066A3B|nr:NAD(P)-dependent oxidoreductase [Massilia sp. Bi118]CAH0164881.1 NAD-dependent dihydropyrimidine dehydrogenase subunit PreT [Massilia sp. Bi118]